MQRRFETSVLLPRRYLIAFKNVLRSIENFGISMVYGLNFFGRGVLQPDNYLQYVRHDVLGTDLLNSSLKFALQLGENMTHKLRSHWMEVQGRFVVHVQCFFNQRSFPIQELSIFAPVPVQFSWCTHPSREIRNFELLR
jgi:hypothetical protein